MTLVGFVYIVISRLVLLVLRKVMATARDVQGSVIVCVCGRQDYLPDIRR